MRTLNSALVARGIATIAGHPFVEAQNKFALMSAHDGIVHVSSTLRAVGALMKIANDALVRGRPARRVGEITIPDNEPGCVDHARKINPTQCEALTQVAVQVFGNDASVAFAGSQATSSSMSTSR
jgi:fumarate hydratase class II